MERISFVNKSVFTHGIVCALCLSLLFACSSSNDEPTTKDAFSVEATITERNSFGNFLLDLSPDSLKKKGFDVGDIVTVSGGSLPGSLDMPITSFTLAVGSWGMCLMSFSNEPTMTLALANASFSDRVGGKVGDRISITMKQKGGYKEQNDKYKLYISYKRSDYDSDEMFANFYPIECSGMKPGLLYRSSSPLMESDNPSRYEYADGLARKVGIRTVFTLAHSEEQWKKALATGSGYGEYCKELYDEGNILFYKSAIDIFVDKEAVKIGEVMRSMLKSDPPFLIHCQHGRDRTGLVGIILQTLAGATYEEVESSYMKAFYNWHRLDASYPYYADLHTILFERILYILSKEGDVDIAKMCAMTSFPTEEIFRSLPSAVVSYLHNKCGLSYDEIERLKNLISLSEN